MPLGDAALHPRVDGTEVVRRDERAVLEPWVEPLERTRTPPRIAVGREPHRASFAVAVPPAQCFRDHAVEPPERAACVELLDGPEPPLLAAPQSRRDPVADPVHRDHELLALVAARVIRGRRM